jgi:hypothetical protein
VAGAAVVGAVTGATSFLGTIFILTAGELALSVLQGPLSSVLYAGLSVGAAKAKPPAAKKVPSIMKKMAFVFFIFILYEKLPKK